MTRAPSGVLRRPAVRETRSPGFKVQVLGPRAFGDALAKCLLDQGSFDFSCEVAANHVAVLLGFFFWEQSDFTSEGFDQAARDAALDAVRKRWASSERGSIPLGVVSH